MRPSGLVWVLPYPSLRMAQAEGKTKTLMESISNINHAIMMNSYEFSAGERLARRRARRHADRSGSPSARAAARLDGELIRAVELILAHPGKVMVTGIGKIGHIARKIVATLCSTGTAAVFLHPAEAVHGDLGIYTPGDPTVLFLRTARRPSCRRWCRCCAQFRSPLIGILGNAASPLARAGGCAAGCALVEREADPHNLAPTASAVTALAIGHALAIALMCARNFTPEEFGRFHPGGQLGRNLRLSVAAAMHTGDEVACVRRGRRCRT